ncbi:hypothetical protein [Micromonospora tulbaghiae]|uniref:hypothetical protein n=1 Tax=Micromonospora tulbaghiae TaxID=479978 RepID=UPI0036B7EB70
MRAQIMILRAGADRQALRAWLNMHDLAAAAALLAASVGLGVAFNGVLIQEFIVPLWSSVSVHLMTPALAGVAVAVAVATRYQWVDAFHVTLSAAARATWIALVTGLASVAVALPVLAADSPGAAWPVLRNLLLFAALGLAGTAAASSTWAWVGPAAYTLLCLVFGQNPSGTDGFRWWAVALEEAAGLHSLLMTAALYVIAAGTLIATDTRRA